MKLHELENAVRSHAGDFFCRQIRNETQTKVVRFVHVVEPASHARHVPAIGGLRDFYDTFGSVVFYYDPNSEDAARYLAPPAEWPELREAFMGWMDGVDEEEGAEMLPGGIETCLVIGETPRSGNYILMVVEGPEAGQVFEFDHDGLEFTHQADNIVAYVTKLLAPDGVKLREMASHMRFIEGDPRAQWWIHELRDNRGHVATTEA